jgi:hypothetical protein
MGIRPTPQHSIERIRNDLDYGPDNCVWATPEEQANNRRTSQRYEFRGKMLTIRQALTAAGSDIAMATVRARVKKGWSLEDAVHIKP